MASFGKGRGKPKQSKKTEIAEKVQEIQLRQKNWMEQREEHLKNRSNNSPVSDKKQAPQQMPIHKSVSKQQSTPNESLSSSQLHKERFKSWLAAKEKGPEAEDDVDILQVSSSRTPGYATPELDDRGPGDRYYSGSDRNEIMNQLMSYEDFDTRASNIVSRVKNGLDLEDRDVDRRHTDNKKSHLSSHYCPICRQLMINDKHAPIIYIPCGHSTCQECSRGRQCCPSCGSSSSSKTTNIMLMQIIKDYNLTSGTSAPERDHKQRDEYSPQNYQPQRQKNINKSKYKEEYENLKMRQEVLQVEIKHLQSQINSYVKEIADSEKQIASVAREEEKVESQIRSLQEKLQLLRHHKQQFSTECDQAKQKRTDIKSKLHQTQDILLTVEIQMEKARLLAEQ